MVAAQGRGRSRACCATSRSTPGRCDGVVQAQQQMRVAQAHADGDGYRQPSHEVGGDLPVSGDDRGEFLAGVDERFEVVDPDLRAAGSVMANSATISSRVVATTRPR